MARTFKFNQDNLLGGISNTNELNSPYNEVKDCNNVMFNISKGVERRNPTFLSDYGSFKNSQNATNLKDACRCPFVYNPDVDYYKEFDYGNEKISLIIFDTKERYDIEISSEIYRYLLNIGGAFAWSGFNLSRKMSFYDFKRVMENLENASSGSIKNYYYSNREKVNGVSYSLTSNFIRFFPVIYNVKTGDIISSYSDFINYELKSNTQVIKNLLNNDELKKYHLDSQTDSLTKENIYELFLNNFDKTRQIFSEGNANINARKTFSSKISNNGDIYIVNRELKTSKNSTLNSEQYFSTINRELLSKVSKDTYSKSKNYFDVLTYSESDKNMYGDEKEEKFYNTIRDRTCEILKINKVDFDTRYEFHFRFDYVESESLLPVTVNRWFQIHTVKEDYYDEVTDTYAADIVNTKYITQLLFNLITSYLDTIPKVYDYYYIELKNDCIYINKHKHLIHNIMKFATRDDILPEMKSIFDKHISMDDVPQLVYKQTNSADGNWNSFGYPDIVIDGNIYNYKNENNEILHSGGLKLDHFALFSNIKSIKVNQNPEYGRLEEYNKNVDILTNTFTVIKPSHVSKNKNMISDYEDEILLTNGGEKMMIFGDIRDFTVIDQKIIPDGYGLRVVLKNENENENNSGENSVIYFIKDNDVLKESSYITSVLYILKKDPSDIGDKKYLVDYLDYTNGYLNDGVVVFTTKDKQNADIIFDQESDYFLSKTPQEPNKSSIVGFDKQYPNFINKKIRDIEFIENRMTLFYENSVYFSETDNYGSWFNSSSLQVFASDPIQATNLKNRGFNFEYVYPFLDTYVITTEGNFQATMTINGVLEINNILFNEFSDYRIDKDIGIKTYNNKLFFVTRNKSGHSLLYNVYKNNNGVLQTKVLNEKVLEIDRPYKDFYIYDNNIIIQLDDDSFIFNTYGYNYDGQKELDIWTKLSFDKFDYTLFDEDYMYIVKDGSSERFYLKNYRNSDENKPKLFVDALTNQDLKCFRVPSNITNWDIYNYQYNPESDDSLEYNTNELGLIITKNDEAYKSIFDKSNSTFLLINGYEYKIKGGFEFEELKGTPLNQTIINDVNESFILLIIDVEYEDLVFDKKTYNSKDEFFTSLTGNFSEYTIIENITIGRHYDSFFELNRFFITDRYSNQKITYGKTNILECGFLYEDTNSFNISVKTDRRPDEKITKMSYKPKINELEPDPNLGIYNKIDNSLFNVKIKSSNKDYSIKLYNNSASNFVIKSLIYKINFENK